MRHPNLQELSQRIYTQNKAAGWWDIPRPRVQTAWLVITELAEATEAERAGKYADLEAFEADLVKDRSLVEECRRRPQGLRDTLWSLSFSKHIKDTFEDEIADAVIRLLDLAGSEGAKLSFLETNPANLLDTSNEEIFFTVSTWLFEDYDGLAVYNSICLLAELSEKKGFDLWQHVDLKLKYNATRGKMHGGKKF